MGKGRGVACTGGLRVRGVGIGGGLEREGC